MNKNATIEALEKKLPFLPGMRFDLNASKNSLSTKVSQSPLDTAIDKGLDHYRKSHAFDYCNGVAIFHDDRPGIGNSPLLGQDKAKVHTSVEVYSQAKSQHNNALNQSDTEEETQVLPAWVAFDRKVLRFYAYFQEAVQESRLEQYRVRRVNIYFYLEDDSIHVSEPRIPSSGIPQGTLIRRHRILKDASDTNVLSQHYIVSDFNVGKEVTFYARTFKIVGCDKFTREFLSESIGTNVPGNTEFPNDPYNSYQQVQRERMRATRPAKKDLALKKFLENDRRVLRFFCTWEDQSAPHSSSAAYNSHAQSGADTRTMVLHLYLSDDTIEIIETIPPNSGRDSHNTRMFLKRSRLPKRPRVNPVNGPIPLESHEYYTEHDLTLGTVIHLYGRPFTLVGCDDFTKNYYCEKYGLEDFDPVPANDDEIEKQKQIETTGTTYQVPPAAPLVPRPPRRDAKKLMAFDGVTLRFSAKLISSKPIDRDRSFIISYYLADDTLSVFEPPQRNSGIVGGKFLERRKFKRDGNSVDSHAENFDKESDYYSTADIFIGAQLILCQHLFSIVGADEHAIKFMKDHPEVFPNTA